MPAKIQKIQKWSAAHRAGLRPGETLLAIDGNPINDVLDFRFYGYDENTRYTVLDKNDIVREVSVIKPAGRDPGITFETYLMDTPRRCSNRCVFCFIDQLPKGLRDTLYFKDDDARLSFLMGNYITLTNLTDGDVNRMVRMGISPVGISVHTTNPALRDRMLGNPKGGKSLALLERFRRAGILMNLQIVVCPGLNDGAELSRTTSDLAAMVPQVNSVSVVPVGLTKYREGLYPLRAVTGEDARSMISITNAMGDHCKKETGRRVFYVSDELYLKAGLPLPDYDYYDEFCQLENGVGMLRLLEHEFWGALENIEKIAGPANKITPFTCVTGAAAKPFLTSLIDGLARKCDNVRDSFNIYCIENRFFGNGVNVAGLITGGDIAGQLAGKPLLGRVLISASMLRHGEDVFLDNMTRAELSKILNRPVIPVENDGKKLLYAMLGIETDGEKHE